ncbi:MAG: acetate kinase [Bradymonadia bacterium]|jgi:acetate kinase
MQILVVNCGSSSLKLALVDPKTGTYVASAKVERIGEAAPTFRSGDGEATACAATDHEAALRFALPLLTNGHEIAGVGHRIVHGGSDFDCAVRLTEENIAKIEALSSLAPLHNPPNVAGVRAAQALLPDVPHIGVFDTAFHSTLPRRARAYAIPAELAEKHNVHRFGFHGTSHAFVARRAAQHLGRDVRDLRIITCHLGSGCSMAAVEYGRSVETSMGMTPLEGLVMGTRSGDIDPGALIALMRAENLDVDGLDRLLNKESGLAGLSGVGNDMRDIESRAAEGDESCRLALHVFCHRIRKYVGSYAAVMGGVDAIVFTAGIGENSPVVRHRVAQRLEFLGATFDEDANRDLSLSPASPVAPFSTPNSRVALLAIATDEQWEIAIEAAHLVADNDKVAQLTIPVAVSARHVHVTQETLEALFGPGATLTPDKPLSQPGQFAAKERVTLVGPKRRIEKVRILGPTRPKNQIEISTTDEFALGLDAPVRASGHVDGTPGITVEGPAGSVTLTDGVICAWRHIHMHPDDAARFGVQDKDVVDVAINSEMRDLIFGDVLVRVSPKYALEMHIDTDEANAAGISRGTEAVLLETDRSATITRRK